MKKNNYLITKASGEQVPFSTDKLKQSLRRTGATEAMMQEILRELEPQLYHGIPTKKIYKLAFAQLKKMSKPTAARYKLKTAIMELGPSGFPFEKYVSEILRYKGYSVQVGQLVQGHCVQHEIDVIAQKDRDHFMVECKYHNLQGISCDVKIPLYIKARFKDVEMNWKQLPGHENINHQAWVVTNTKFTSDAIQYGLCAGLHLVAWNFPAKDNLKSLIDESSLYPLTCLSVLSKGEKQNLLDQKVVLCRELYDQPALLRNIHISETRIESILKELKLLIDGEKHMD